MRKFSKTYYPVAKSRHNPSNVVNKAVMRWILAFHARSPSF